MTPNKNRFPQYKGKVKLNLGCGAQRLDGFIGIDIREVGQEMMWDVRGGIPFPDNSVDAIYSCHFIEHMTDSESIALFKDIYRALKVGGETHHRCPHQTHPTAYFWGHETFWNEARVASITRVPGLEKFLIVDNQNKHGELFFSLKKLG